MSGISTGSIFFTPAMMMIAAVNASEKLLKTTAKCAFAGVIAVHNYNKKQEQKKIKKLSTEIDILNRSVSDCIFSQSGLFDESSEKLINSIKNMQAAVSESINESNIDDFKNVLHDAEIKTMQGIDRVNSEFQKKYTEVINKSNAEISSALSSIREKINDEIKSIDETIISKQTLEMQRATSLVSDAKELLKETYSAEAENHIHRAELDIEKENFQTAIGIAASAITEIYISMYRNDAEEKEKQLYAQSCIFMIAEIKECLDSLTETEYKNDQASEETMLIDLTQFMEGKYQNFYDELGLIEKNIFDNTEIMTVTEINKQTEKLNHLYMEITESIVDAFCLMTYNLNRLEVEKEIYTILNEKGFSLVETRYTDGDPSKAGERKYKCALTDEELTISIIPYANDDNEINTELIMESNDINCSEESREQYRAGIIDALSKKCRQVDNVKLKCKENTKNMNAKDIDTSSFRISNPMPQKTFD